MIRNATAEDINKVSLVRGLPLCDYYIDCNDNQWTFVFEENGCLIAYVTLRSSNCTSLHNDCEIDIFVIEGATNNGVGSLLMSEAVKWFENSEHYSRLVAGVTKANFIAFDFLKKHGFELESSDRFGHVLVLF